MMERINPTKTSELRAQSQLADKALNDMGDHLELLKKQKGFRNDASFADIEKEKYKLQRALLLPPIEKVRSLHKSLNPSYSSSPYHLAWVAHGRQSQPQLQKRIDKLGFLAPVLGGRNPESARASAGNVARESALQKKSLDQFNSLTGDQIAYGAARLYQD